MSFLTLIGIAVGLAMDAFAVSIGVGLTLRGADARQTFRLAWHFGLFQALMPVIGWAAGLTVEGWVAPVDHWVAFALLAAVGGKMVYEGLAGSDDERPRGDPTRGLSLVVLSVATSIDALAVGFSLALVGVDIWYPAVVIGLVAGGLTAVGLRLGERFGALLGRRMEVAGGVILIFIGLRIVLDHLGVW